MPHRCHDLTRLSTRELLDVGQHRMLQLLDLWFADYARIPPEKLTPELRRWHGQLSMRRMEVASSRPFTNIPAEPLPRWARRRLRAGSRRRGFRL